MKCSLLDISILHNNCSSFAWRRAPTDFLHMMMPFQFMDTPARTCWHAIKGAVRSTTFLSAFVGIFQVAVCVSFSSILLEPTQPPSLTLLGNY